MYKSKRRAYFATMIHAKCAQACAVRSGTR